MRTRRILLVGIVLVVVVFARYAWLRMQTRSYIDDLVGIRSIQKLVLEMANQEIAGVERLNGRQSYVVSFDAVLEYVRKYQPSVTVRGDAANPFPGLLEGKAYGRLHGYAHGPDELIFWSIKPHEMSDGRCYLAVTCGGDLININRLPNQQPVGTTHSPKRGGENENGSGIK